MDCKDCAVNLESLEGKYDTYLYCPSCYIFYGSSLDWERRVEECCNNPDQIFVKHQIRGGTFQLKKQCQNCGLMPSNAFKQEGKDINTYPLSDVRLRDEVLLFRRSERLDKEIEVKRIEHSGFERNIDYLASKYKGYPEYLRSDDWKIKRKLVLKRDKNICQSCLAAKASEVHHVTYKHIFNEPLFDLVSVCTPCHISITLMDSYELKYEKIIHSTESTQE